MPRGKGPYIIGAVVVGVACLGVVAGLLLAPEGRHVCDPDLSILESTKDTNIDEVLDSWFPARVAWIDHQELLWSQPNVVDVGYGLLRDGKGGWDDTWGINVWVSDRLDQSRLPDEFRLPPALPRLGSHPGEILGYVPVRILDEDPLPSPPTEPSCHFEECMSYHWESRGFDHISDYGSPSKEYRSLFWHQPNIYHTTFTELSRPSWYDEWLASYFESGYGVVPDHPVGVDVYGKPSPESHVYIAIEIRVARAVDQRALPPEYRIPECLKGMPVKITEPSKLRKTH